MQQIRREHLQHIHEAEAESEKKCRDVCAVWEDWRLDDFGAVRLVLVGLPYPWVRTQQECSGSTCR
jgi:hypothetical protein